MCSGSDRQWSVNDLAQAAGVTPQYVRRLLAKSGSGLSGIKLGRDWFVDDAEAKRWLASRGK